MYESETWNGSGNELTTESESDIEEDSDKGDYSACVLTLKEHRFPSTEIEEIDVTEEKSLTFQRNTQLISDDRSRVTQMWFHILSIMEDPQGAN